MRKTKGEISVCPFKIGDLVKLNEAGLANKVLIPSEMVAQGYPNEFSVIAVRNHDVEIYPIGTISLSECCGKKVNKTACCTGHPAECFEIVS